MANGFWGRRNKHGRTRRNRDPPLTLIQRPVPRTWIVGLGVGLTAVALAENHPAWYEPGFIPIYAMLAIAIPLHLKTYQWDWKNLQLRRHWPLLWRAAFLFWGLFAVNLFFQYALLSGAGQWDNPQANWIRATTDIIAGLVQRMGVPAVALIYLFFFGIWPMFGEELTYRGLLFGGLRQKLPFLAAATVAGLFFAVRHSIQILPGWSGQVETFPWIAFFGAAIHPFIGGYVYAWVYERTHNLALPMLLHGVNNVAAWLALVFLFAR